MRRSEAVAVATATAPRSLRRQLLLHLSAPLLAVLVFGAFGGMIIARHVGYQVHDQWLLDSAMTLNSQVRLVDGRASLALPQVAIDMFRYDRVDRIYWQASTARHGVLLANASIAPPPALAMRADKPLFFDAIIEGAPVRVVAVEVALASAPADTLRIMVAETMHKREALAGKIVAQSAPLQAAVLFLAGMFVWLAVSRNLRQLDRVAAQLGSYDTGSLTPVADSARMPAEIAPLVGAINRLLAKLSDEQHSQQRFIANAAHQLRTPLATLQVQTARVSRETDPAKQQQALGDVYGAVTRLHHVTHQLLTLMRSEAQVHPHLTLGSVDLAVLARDEVERWTDRALKKHIDLGYDGAEHGVMVLGDSHLLRELLSNLLDNAIRYSDAGGTVTLSIAADPLRLTVDDDGPGIAEHERGLVLERFFRGSASEGTSGCGLGLPIAFEIAARHGAHLSIAAAPGRRGARIAVAFPLPA
ncbi:sensor histidine kinase [Massilia sp. PWRC2]|uniref:sensor histidine kinase n=1 Tax=Massilia sp. PWRC2 TaxID=2804626 RepID=UPI003CEE34FF